MMYGREFGKRARADAMKQEIACKNGNFCGVCPVIGLRDPTAAYIAVVRNRPANSVGHFSWHGVIRPVKRIGTLSTVPSGKHQED